MSYKTLLLHVDDDARCGARTDFAFALAERFDAHLAGLYALAALRIPSYALAEAGPIVSEIEARLRAERTRAREAEFRSAARRAGRPAEWRVSSDDAAPALAQAARYADLLVAGQPEPDDRARLAACGDLLLAAARPVLFLRYAGGFRDIGRRVLVAWNGSREAARAVTDALPFLARAKQVEVVAFGAATEPAEVPAADVALYLARHGVKASAARQAGIGVEIDAQILSRAADFEADLVVMGAYGHSRLREAALGGATRGLLKAMTVPVLMSH